MSRELSKPWRALRSFFSPDTNRLFHCASEYRPRQAADLCEVGYVFDPNQLTLTRRLTQSNNALWDFYARPAAWYRTFDTTKDTVLANDTVLSVSFTCFDIQQHPIIYSTPSNALPYEVEIELDAVDSRTVTKLQSVGGMVASQMHLLPLRARQKLQIPPSGAASQLSIYPTPRHEKAHFIQTLPCPFAFI